MLPSMVSFFNQNDRVVIKNRETYANETAKNAAITKKITTSLFILKVIRVS